jgi:FAD/FMN-containing dehydrogenase
VLGLSHPGAAPDPRRRALVQALLSAGVLAALPAPVLGAPSLVIDNVTGLYPIEVARIDVPKTTEQVAQAVRRWPGQVAVGGGRYSMGGQVAVRAGLHLDMREMNGLVWIRPEEKCVRVQAGMRWRELQDIVDPLALAVKTMQSYANFSIGSSVSVNAHGRYVGHGPVGNTVKALQLVMADGAIVETSPAQRPELFRAAIGGYGAVGVVTEVELVLADNVRIERIVQPIALKSYVAHFDKSVSASNDSLLHNADLLPPRFDKPVGITWRRTDRPATLSERLVPRGAAYGLERNVIWAVTELPGGGKVQKGVIHPLMRSGDAVRWLNREASIDVAELEPASRKRSTYVLQEYFVPRGSFLPFARAMGRALVEHSVRALNISIRHSPPDTVALLPWARDEVFAFVLYYKQDTSPEACEAVGRWTRELIDLALAHGGRYYLPYQLHATREQFERAYPEAAELRSLKAQVDPARKFSNAMWEKYL